MDAKITTFGSRNFGDVDLGDRRRTAALVKAVDRMCRHPGGTLPEKFNRPADLRSFYRLMDRPEVTHEILIAAHAHLTRALIANATPGVVLILHDATELDYTTKTTVAEHLSQIGQGTRRGYICHNSLAVRADTGGVLGLTSQILHHRATVPDNETLKQKRERDDRESRLWLTAARASGPTPPDVLCVDVSDRLSDTFEYMAFEVTHGRHFLLRQRDDRGLAKELAGHASLVAGVAALPSRGQRTLKVQATPGRSARTTTVAMAFSPICLKPPAKAYGEYPNEPLDLWAVRVWEPDTPVGEKPLEWILLTNVPVRDVEEAEERVNWYQKRWIIEEYHKGMKTGCRIESLQFDTLGRLGPAIAVLSVVTTTLLQLRDAARAPDADRHPATDFIGEDYVAVLVSHYGSRLGPNPTVRAFLMHVARLGGHQNRKADGFPGWLTLWRGWTRLQAMVDGYHAAHRKIEKKCGIN